MRPNIGQGRQGEGHLAKTENGRKRHSLPNNPRRCCATIGAPRRLGPAGDWSPGVPAGLWCDVSSFRIKATRSRSAHCRHSEAYVSLFLGHNQSKKWTGARSLPVALALEHRGCRICPNRLSCGRQRGYITREAARDRVLATLRFFQQAPQGPQRRGTTGHKGFFYHFLDMETGHRAELPNCRRSIRRSFLPEPCFVNPTSTRLMPRRRRSASWPSSYMGASIGAGLRRARPQSVMAGCLSAGFFPTIGVAITRQ